MVSGLPCPDDLAGIVHFPAYTLAATYLRLALFIHSYLVVLLADSVIVLTAPHLPALDISILVKAL